MSLNIVLIGLYTFIRLLSFATLSIGWIQTVTAALAIFSITYFGVKKPLLAWYVLITEFFLDGNGHFFELFGIAVRTWFVTIFFSCWFIRKFKDKKLIDAFQLPKILKYTLLSLGFSILIGIIVGIINGHDLHAIISDAIPYFFLLLLFPAKEFIPQTSKKIVSYIFSSYITGTTLFALFTETLFSSGFSILQSPYYHWFRDIVGGKITDVGNHFFRITAPEYLILPIVLLTITAFIIKEKKSSWQLWILLLLASIPMLLSVSRTFILTYVIGLLFLVEKTNFRRWFAVSLSVMILLFSTFSTLHFTFSHGTSFGFELFSSRFGGIVNPDSEVSSASRKALLVPIFSKIKAHPMFGSGLATTLTYTDRSGEIKNTTQFDWGYLETYVELGLLGLVSTLALLVYLFTKVKTNAERASLVVLAFMHITTPAVFHVFGVVALIWFMTTIDASSQLSVSPLHNPLQNVE